MGDCIQRSVDQHTQLLGPSELENTLPICLVPLGNSSCLQKIHCKLNYAKIVIRRKGLCYFPDLRQRSKFMISSRGEEVLELMP